MKDKLLGKIIGVKDYIKSITIERGEVTDIETAEGKKLNVDKYKDEIDPAIKKRTI